MKYRRLGRTELEVSEIGFGGWALGGGAWGNQQDRESLAALDRAIDLGINFIDTAAGYGKGRSERVIARALKARTERVYVATKIHPLPGPWPPSPYCDIDARYPADYLRQKVEERLENLDTACVDILQLHTWTRAWNKNPRALETLKELQAEGKIRYIGMSTPEHDQNCVIDLMRQGYVDVVRVPFDEGALTGKFSNDTTFPEGDFRANYFAGDRLVRTVDRVEKIKSESDTNEQTMVQVALKFILAQSAVSSVIPGIRNVAQAKMNAGVSDSPDLSSDLIAKLRKHAWRRSFWYAGK